MNTFPSQYLTAHSSFVFQSTLLNLQRKLVLHLSVQVALLTSASEKSLLTAVTQTCVTTKMLQVLYFKSTVRPVYRKKSVMYY